MNIRELINKLNEIEDKEKLVLLEGCDCFGEWNGLIELLNNEEYLLKRKTAEDEWKEDED